MKHQNNFDEARKYIQKNFIAKGEMKGSIVEFLETIDEHVKDLLIRWFIDEQFKMFNQYSPYGLNVPPVKQIKRKEMLELLEQFEETGGVTHYCPECEAETSPTEIDNDKAWCDHCNKIINVPRVM